LELDFRFTTVPPVPAAALNVTLHEAEVDHPMEPGQETAPEGSEMAGETVIVPPVAETVTDDPPGDAPTPPLTAMDAVLAVDVRVTFTTATTPLETIFVLIPETIHV
jgi:hypothetical protein